MAEQIIVDYKTNLDEYLRKLGQVGSETEKQTKKSQDGFKNLQDTIKSVGAAMGIAFGAQQLAAFTKDAVVLAGKLEGVRVAFNRIGDGKMLQGLRDATKGTVSDLNLMTAAVRASNFKIPLEQMGTLLEFARRRAKETGEDINYLVESIVVGIGRKSPLILDNLGISAVELRKRFKGISIEAAEVGDIAKIVGDIATEELGNMGTEAITTGDRLAQISAEFENIQTAAGKAMVSAINFFDVFGDKKDLQAAATRQAIDDWAKHDKAVRDAYSNIQNILFDTSDKEEQLSRLRKSRTEAQVELSKLQSKEQRNADVIALSLAQKRIDAAVGFNIIDHFAARENLKNTEKQIEGHYRREKILEAVIALYDKQIEGEKAVTVVTASQIRNLAFLDAEIERVTNARKEGNVTIEETHRLNKELGALELERIDLLDKQKDKVQENSKAWEEWLAQVEAFNQGIEKYRDMQLEKIDNAADIERLIALRTYTDKETLAKRFFDIEQKRLSDRIAMLEQFGRDSISEQKTLEQNKIREAEASWAILEDGYKRFLEGQDADYEASLKKRKEQQQAYNDWEEQQRQEQLDLFNATSSAILQISTAASQYQQQLADQRYADIDRLVENSLITEEEADRRRRRLAREQAKQNKEMAIFQATIGTATAVVNAMATAPNFIIGAIMAVAAGIAGGIEIATIEAQPLPEFGKGGWVGGKSHDLGGTKIEAEKDEFVVNKRAAKKHRDVIEAINRDMFDPLQYVGWDDIDDLIRLNGNQFSDRNLLRAIDRHREAEVSTLRDLLHEVRKSNGRPLRGGYNA